MAFSIFTTLYNHHHYLIPEHFHHSKRKLVPIKHLLRISITKVSLECNPEISVEP